MIVDTPGSRLPTTVPMRTPLFEARASSRPRPRATQDVTFRVDQVLKRHSGLPSHRIASPASYPRASDMVWCPLAATTSDPVRKLDPLWSISAMIETISA
jgi:hypothetical protein